MHARVSPTMRHLSSLLTLSWLLATTFALPSPPSAAPAQAADANRSLDAGIDELVRTRGVPGMSVAAYHQGRLVYSRAAGRADLELEVPATPAIRFGIGSITKSLTTALCARLVDQGLLDLDAPVETYLPDFPYAGRGITVRLLAGHLSGYGDEFSTARWLSNEHVSSTREAMVQLWTEPLIAAPGAEHHYANGSYTIIAGVIEKVTGTTFDAALAAEVLEPLGMRDTVPNDPTIIVPGRTSFYLKRDDGTIHEAPTFDPSHKQAAAGYLSTAEDLARFGHALLSDGFLSPESRRQLFTALKTSGGEDTGFALGWRVATDDHHGIVYHQPGGGPGISTWIYLLPEEQLVLVALSNLTRAPVGDAINLAAEQFGGRP